MSDEFATEAPDIATGPAETAVAPATPSSTAGDPDIDSLLGEFDRSRPSEKAAPAEPSVRVPARADAPLGHSDDDFMAMQLRQISNDVVMRSLLDHQIATSERLQFEEWQRNERADFADTVKEAASMLEDFPHVGDPSEFAKRFLLSEAQLNPDLYDAWQHRRESKEHWQRAERALARACRKMLGEVKRMPDPELSADRALVTAMMRGGSGKPPPADDAAYARRVSSMNDADFQAEADRLMGR